jgi:carboxyl-terminal processing protease
MRIFKEITKRERSLWIGITLFLAGFILLFSFAPGLVAQGESSEDQRALQKLNDTYYYIKDYFVDGDKTDTKKLIDGALEGLFKSLDDPYSAYITAESLRDLEDTSTGSFGGVGLVISKERLFDKNGAAIEKTPIEVVSPIDGTPAFKAGVNAGDLIIKVEGDSTLELSLDEVVKKLRGAPGSSVTMTIRRGQTLEFDVSLVRANIEIPTVKSALINNTTGYIKIIEFTKYTPARVKEVIADLVSKGMTSLIIDVRSNPGGVLDAVTTIADYFISDGPLVSVKGRMASENVVYNAKKSNDLVPATMPIAILIDKGSASASEILAGALKDSGRAQAFGEKSYGKGTVQRVKFTDDSGFKLTVARFYSPSGATIDKVGVSPNVEVKEEDYTDAEKASYEKIIKDNLIGEFIKQHPQPGEKETSDFIVQLQKQGIALREIALRRLILREVYRTVNDPPIYDLGTDLVLQKAMESLAQKAN